MKRYEALGLPDDARWITVQVALPPTLDIGDVRDELRGTAFAVKEIDPSKQPQGAVEEAARLRDVEALRELADAKRDDLAERLLVAVEELLVIANDTTHDGRWAASRAERALVAMGVDPRAVGGQ